MKKLILLFTLLLNVVLGAGAQLTDLQMKELQGLLTLPPAEEEQKRFELPEGFDPDVQNGPVVPGEFFWTDPAVVREKITFLSPYGDRAKGYVFKPAGLQGKIPGILVLSGAPGAAATKSLLARDLAKSGAAVLIFDALPARLPASRQVPSLEKDRELLSFMVKDYRLMLRYLKTIPEVAEERLGVIGESMGGCWGVMVSCLELNVRASVFQISLPGYHGHRAFGLRAASAYEQRFSSMGKEEYYRELKAYLMMDPLRYTQLPRTGEILWQNGTNDMVFPEKNAQTLLALAGGPKTLRWYPVGHNVNTKMDEEARAWLMERLR